MSKEKPFDLYLSGKLSIKEFHKLADIVKEDSSDNILGLTKEEFLLYRRLGSNAIEGIKKARQQKKDIIEKAKNFFRDEIAESHRKNSRGLVRLILYYI